MLRFVLGLLIFVCSDLFASHLFVQIRFFRFVSSDSFLGFSSDSLVQICLLIRFF